MVVRQPTVRTRASTGVRIWSGSLAPLSRPAALAARLETPVEEWPYLDEGTLVKTRSRKVCMTCHWFRHHAGVNCIPLLTCQLHQGLIAHGEHLSSRCQGWTDDMTRQQGWAPEVA
jgi:hypothetical protein